jgi:hypothetical protein
MNKRSKRSFILLGAKRALLFSMGAAGVLSIIVVIYSLIKSSPIMRNVYTSLYYLGAFSLIFSVPQLYKRNEDASLRKVRATNIFKPNRNPYEEQAMMESFEEFRGDGFWTGMFIVLFSILLFSYAIVLEKIHIAIGG